MLDSLRLAMSLTGACSQASSRKPLLVNRPQRVN